MSSDDHLKNLVDSLEAAAKKNPGPEHELLLTDIYALRNVLLSVVHEAEDLQFHDYANEKYPAPKVALVTALQVVGKHCLEMAEQAKNGRYDNGDPLKQPPPV